MIINHESGYLHIFIFPFTEVLSETTSVSPKAEERSAYVSVYVAPPNKDEMVEHIFCY